MRNSYWILLLVAACGSPLDVDFIEEPIAMERGDQVQVVARKYDPVDDPEVTLKSYAAPSSNCSGAMIGPNLYMTASHCHPTPGDPIYFATFTVYDRSDPTRPRSEAFACKTLYHTWPRSDLILAFCEPNALGENPGDKYGYFDLDSTPPQPEQLLYSLWSNEVKSLGLKDAALYSEGRIISTKEIIWPGNLGISNVGPIGSPVGIWMDLWAQGGVSGSSGVNPQTHRIVVGPTSTGSVSGPGKTALSIDTLMHQATVEPDFFDAGQQFPTGLRPNTIAAHTTVSPTSYYGGLDKNGNGLFDVQEDIESARGENRRDVYYLGFESERRNRLWTTGTSAWIYPASGIARLWAPTANQVMRHAKLNLKPNTTYTITLGLRVYATSSASGLAVMFQKSALQDVSYLPTVADATLRTRTVRLRTGAESPDLVIWAGAGLYADLSDVLVVEDGAVMNFDSDAKRVTWRNEESGKHALIVPDTDDSTSVNWAAAVTRGFTTPVTSSWTVSNRQLPFKSGLPYELCFDIKGRGTFSPALVNWGEVQILNGATQISRRSFTPTVSWQTICVGAFTATADEGVVRFGARVEGASFLVDNVMVRANPTSNLIGYGGKCLAVLGANPSNGGYTGMWDCLGYLDQKWSPTDGYLMAFSGRALDVLGAASHEGAQVGVWDPYNGANQKWRFHYAKISMGSLLLSAPLEGWALTSPGIYDYREWSFTPAGELKSINGKCLTTKAGPEDLWVGACDGSPAQRFRLAPGGQIRDQFNRCVSAAGSFVRAQSCGATDTQKWTIRGELRGYLDKCLDVYGSSTANGTSARMYNCYNTPNQQWTYVP